MQHIIQYLRERRNKGYALPMVVVLSTALLTLGLAILDGTVSTRQALLNQTYARMAQEAAQSGIVYAQWCLQNNSYVAQWSNAKPLQPNTDCSGTVRAGVTCPGQACSVAYTSGVRTSFSVGAPTVSSASQRLSATGTVSLVKGGGTSYRSYTSIVSATTGVNLNINKVAFGYVGSHAFFFTLAPGGIANSVGYNGYWQLGNGTTSNTLTPIQVVMPAGVTVASIYTNFVSGGIFSFFIGSDGNVYGAGIDSSGNLGDGTTNTTNVPVRFILPAGVTGKSVTMGSATYVVGSDGNIYAAGNCDVGQLGDGSSGSGCYKSTPVRVQLPAGETSANVVTTDYKDALFLTTSGKVYGVGENGNGQLGAGNTTMHATPVQFGTLGNSGQPKAVDVVTDGVSAWVRASDGNVYSAGYNFFGQLGTTTYPGTASWVNQYSSTCLDADLNTITSNNSKVQLWGCNSALQQKWIYYTQDNTVHSEYNGRCLTVNTSSGGANGSIVMLSDCVQGATNQIWTKDGSGRLVSGYNNSCLDADLNTIGANGTKMQIWSCLTGTNQKWTFNTVGLPLDSSTPARFNLPAGVTAKSVTTDQWSVNVVGSDGNVYGAGLNSEGQLGNGVGSGYAANPIPVKFALPVGVTGTKAYTTAYGGTLPYLKANTLVLGSDGKVYCTGENIYGQCGIGTTASVQLNPVTMLLPAGVSGADFKIGAGTCVVLGSDGKIYTVGNNGDGQLGDGTTTNRSTPAATQYTNVVPLMVF